MPAAPKRPKRPADVVGNAIKVARIATGKEEDVYEPEPVKNAAAVEMGKLGGRKRAESMTPERRAEIALKAAERRWAKR